MNIITTITTVPSAASVCHLHTEPAPFQNIFERYEKKYLLNLMQYKKLLAGAAGKIQADQYGLATIYSLYLDTDNYQLIRTSLEKPLYKEKLRLRSYGIPSQDSTVFLELKKKYRGIVYKRRIGLPYREAMTYLVYGEKPEQSGQIFQEIDWAMQTYRPAPKALIMCDRMAYFGIENPDLRLTFDFKLRFRSEEHYGKECCKKSSLDMTFGDNGEFLLDPMTVLLEIKIPGAMPQWLSSLLSQLSIFPVSFSKYGSCYKQFLNKNIQLGGITCA